MTEENRPRTLPHSRESEMMVLGCMLNSIDALNIAAGELQEGHFYLQEHQLIFRVLQEAYKGDRPADIHLVAEELNRREELKAAGGVGYLTTLAQFAGGSVLVDQYVELVRNKALLRRMILTAQKVEGNAYRQPKDVFSALDQAQAAFYEIGQSLQTHEGLLLKEVLDGAATKSGKHFLHELEARQEAYQQRGTEDPGITGIPTHFYDLDRMINGLGNSNLIILAARPAMGKTALALNVASNVCFKNRMPVGLFSLEMSADQLVERMVSSHAEVEATKIKNGSLDHGEYRSVVEAVGEMRGHKMVIDDQAGLSISDLRARARRMREAHGIELLVIDYLQLISGSGSVRSQENRQNEISEISRMLKNLARELNIPILCLSQLSRKVEERPDHRPVMSDLRESGAIEQDADIVLLLMRREYYDPHDKPGMAELYVGKNRHGSVGRVDLHYNSSIVRFDSLARQSKMDPVPFP